MNNIDIPIYLEENKALLMYLANKFYLDTPKFSKDDLIQEANLAATRAIERFDPDRDVKISTYVYTTVKRSIRDFVRKNKHDLYITCYQQDKEFRANKHEKQVDIKHRMATRIEGESSMADTIPSGDLSPLDEIQKREELDILKEEIDALPQNEKEIIKERFILNNTFESIGRSKSISRQRAQQISKRAINRLKENLERRLK